MEKPPSFSSSSNFGPMNLFLLTVQTIGWILFRTHCARGEERLSPDQLNHRLCQLRRRCILGSHCTAPSPLSQDASPSNLLPPPPLHLHPLLHPRFSVLSACLQTGHAAAGACPCPGDLLSPGNGAGGPCQLKDTKSEKRMPKKMSAIFCKNK